MSKNHQHKAEKIFNKALLAAQHQRFEVAEGLFKSVLKVFPGHYKAMNNLALCLIHQVKKPKLIEQLLLSAIKTKPDYQDAYKNLIEFYKETSRQLDAVKIYYRYFKRYKGTVTNELDYAILLQTIGQVWWARSILMPIVDNHPENHEARFYLANVHLRLGENAQAIKHFNYLLEREFNIVALNNLAMCHLSMGDKTKSEQIIRQSIAEHPEYTESYRYLSMLKKFSREDDEDIILFEKMLKSAKLKPRQKMQLQFALGKAYDDCGNYKQAFDNYKLANQFYRASLDYDSNDAVGMQEKMIDAYTNCEYVNADIVDDQPVPIFIVGMPRSGTSLLEQIFSTVDSIEALGELTFIENLTTELSITKEIFYPEQHSRLDKSTINNLRDKYTSRVSQMCQSSSNLYIVDKQPFNFWHIGFILQLFPHAKIIHSIRDPIDTCLSNYFQFFYGNLGYVYDLNEIAAYYKLHTSLMFFWKRLYPESIIEADYEHIVKQPESTLMALFDFLSIPWNKAYLDFYLSKRPVRTMSLQQVRSPIYKSSVKRWKNYEPWIKELLNQFPASSTSGGG